jgi:hypothetical protein
MTNPVENAVVPMRAHLPTGGKPVGIVPQSFEDVWRMAALMSKTKMVPADFQNKEADCAVAIMYGLELGMTPVVALQSIAVVNGRPSVWGDALITLCHKHGHLLDEQVTGEGEEMVATCTLKRADGRTIKRSFSVSDAKTASLWGKAVWKNYPKRMLQMRARGYAVRDGAAEILAGTAIVEEQMDVPQVEMRDVTPASMARPSSAPAKSAITDLPDIPDEPEQPVADQAAVLRDLEKRLEAAPAKAAEIEREFASAIMAMDETGREAAVDMIQAAKAQAPELPL